MKIKIKLTINWQTKEFELSPTGERLPVEAEPNIIEIEIETE